MMTIQKHRWLGASLDRDRVEGAISFGFNFAVFNVRGVHLSGVEEMRGTTRPWHHPKFALTKTLLEDENQSVRVPAKYKD